MPAQFEDAKAWLDYAIQNQTISLQDLALFVGQYVTNDDIENYFGVSMDSPDDNPGVDERHCSNCGQDVNVDDYNDSRDMCNECVAETDEQERQEQEDDERDGVNDHKATVMIIEADPSTRTFWIRPTDLDYDHDEDHNHYAVDCRWCGSDNTFPITSLPGGQMCWDCENFSEIYLRPYPDQH